MDTTRVEIWWMFGESWDRHWIPWRDPQTKKAYKEVMDVESLLLDSHGVAAKLEFVTRRKRLILHKKSQAIIQEILTADGYSTSAADN
jgi:hypothetical protein